jgi:holo-[acyl-carrier protein] synthase
MRVYQGIDLVRIVRFREVFSERESLLADVFTEREREQSFAGKDPLGSLAVRFAVKEACLKALGLGLSGLGMDELLREVEVLMEERAKPQIAAHGWLAATGRRKRIDRWAVAVARTFDCAAAAVVLTSNGIEAVRLTR